MFCLKGQRLLYGTKRKRNRAKRKWETMTLTTDGAATSTMMAMFSVSLKYSIPTMETMMVPTSLVLALPRTTETKFIALLGMTLQVSTFLAKSAHVTDVAVLGALTSRAIKFANVTSARISLIGKRRGTKFVCT